MKVGFDEGIKLEFHGAKVTSDGRLLADCDPDDALGLFENHGKSQVFRQFIGCKEFNAENVK